MRGPATRTLERGAVALVLALVVACSSDARGPGDDDPPADHVERVPGVALQPDEVALSPDGGQVVVPCLDDLCVWDAAGGSSPTTHPGGDVVAWSAQDLLATSGFTDDGGHATVVVLDPRTGEELQVLPAHEVAEAQDEVGAGVSDLAFSPDGDTLAGTGDDGTVRLWSVPDGKELAVLETASATPDALAFSPDGGRLAVAAPDAPVEIWEVAPGELVATLDAVPQGEVAWSPDGRLLATDTHAADATATVTLWDATSLEETATYPEPVQADGLAFSPDSTTLAMSQKDENGVLLWPVGDGEARVLSGHQEPPRAVVWAPDGSALYSVAGRDGVIRWDLETDDVARRYDLPSA